jgi:two-component system response regulator BaeR
MILIVEDEPKLATLVRDYLNAAGYETECLTDGNEVIPAVRNLAPELVLLDIMLPGRDGLDVCRELRTISEVPIILVTARVEEIDRLLGLEMGADDYICKPFSPRELVARVKAILRRVRTSGSGAGSLTPDVLAIDAAQHNATLDGKTLLLTPVEFRLLQALHGARGKILSRNHLLDGLYHDHRVVTDRTVDSHVKNLRRKLEAVRPGQDLIRSIYGVGYKLEL